MITIGRIPKKLKSFFTPVRDHFTQRAWEHFWALTMAITITHKVTIDRLTKALRGSAHRTNHGEFLWRSVWNSSIVMQQIALVMLLSLFRKNDRPGWCQKSADSELITVVLDAGRWKGAYILPYTPFFSSIFWL